MEHYTARQVKRAQAQEQLLKRLNQGEDFAAICQELGLHLCKDYLSALRRRYRQGGSCWEGLVDHRHGHPSKARPGHRAWLRERKREDLALTQQKLADLYTTEFEQTISQSHVSNVLRAEGVAIPGGQRYHPQAQGERVLPVERAGVFFP